MTHATCCDFCGRIKPKFPLSLLDTHIYISNWRTVQSWGSIEDLCPTCYDLLKKIGKDRKSGRDIPYVEVIDKK